MNSLVQHNKPVFLSLCCQHCISTNGFVETKHIQNWLQVSRATAIKIGDYFVTSGHMTRETQKWRSNAVKYYYKPVQSVFTSFRRGEFRDEYLLWAARKYR